MWGSSCEEVVIGSIAVGRLFAGGSCSSDSKSSSPAASGTAAGGGVDVSGLADVHAQVYTMGLRAAAAKGVTVDDACLKGIIAQLSAADAKLIVDAGQKTNPTLSAAGKALGAKLPTCTAAPTG